MKLFFKDNKKKVMIYKVVFAAACICFVIGAISVGGSLWGERNPLDSDNPLLLTMWHYRVGSAKVALDEAVEHFNATVGEEEGIVVEAFSIGNIEDLSNAVYASASGAMGSSAMPNIFTAYNEHAFQVDRGYGLVNLEDYFTEEELSGFNSVFLESGRIGEKRELKNLPGARSTECIYLNRTDWDKFAGDRKINISELATWEGILRVAEQYYDWSGGNPFYGAQDIVNTMKVTAALEREKAGIGDGVQDPELYYSREAARKIWDCYYVPYLKGYYSMEVEDSQSMNLMKQGKLLMAVASTAGAVYCPDQVWISEAENYPIQCESLYYPVYSGEEKYAPLRGNSFCITKSDYQHEYASAVFLKWFTAPEQNVSYAIPTGYLPVQEQSLSMKVLFQKDTNVKKVVKDAQETALKMLDEYKMYGDDVTLRSSDFDNVFRELMQEWAVRDKTAAEARMAAGNSREEVLSEYLSPEYFEKWYASFLKNARQIEVVRMSAK